MRFYFCAFAFLIFLPQQVVACSFSRFSSAKKYVKEVIFDEDVAFVGEVSVKEKVEIDRFIFYRFFVEKDLLKKLSNDRDSYFVGYSRGVPPEGGWVRITSCDLSKAFDVGDNIFLTLYKHEGFDSEPYPIDLGNVHLGGFTPEEIEKQIELMK